MLSKTLTDTVHRKCWRSLVSKATLHTSIVFADSLWICFIVGQLFFKLISRDENLANSFSVSWNEYNLYSKWCNNIIMNCYATNVVPTCLIVYKMFILSQITSENNRTIDLIVKRQFLCTIMMYQMLNNMLCHNGVMDFSFAQLVINNLVMIWQCHLTCDLPNKCGISNGDGW